MIILWALPYVVPYLVIGLVAATIYYSWVGFMRLSQIFLPLPHDTRMILTAALILGVLFLIWYLHRRFVFWLFGKAGFNYDEYQSKQKQSSQYQEQNNSTHDDHTSQNPFAVRPQSKEPHEILGVLQGASSGEIRQAYIEKMKLNHPDKVATLDPYLQNVAKERTQDIQNAYEKLSA